MLSFIMLVLSIGNEFPLLLLNGESFSVDDLRLVLACVDVLLTIILAFGFSSLMRCDVVDLFEMAEYELAAWLMIEILSS